uniref:Uncharacterized protein n=1 Tax=uncultured bacterium BLR5 TaxID=506522 RepID=C0INW2_9BACT|nr:hypothetical protein AKSOIL_0035 [uncultured bacterium BLR5]
MNVTSQRLDAKLPIPEIRALPQTEITALMSQSVCCP